MIESTTNKQTYIVTQRENPDVFNFPVRFFDADDIVVAIGGTAAHSGIRLTRGVEYDVLPGEYTSGGTVTLYYGEGNLPALEAMLGKSVTIIRELDLTQTLSLPTHGVLPSEQLEQRLDRIICICQQLEEAFSRCVSVSVGSDLTPGDFFETVLASTAVCLSAAEAAEEAKEIAQQAAEEAKQSTVPEHNVSPAAHQDIRQAASSLVNAHNADATAHPGIRDDITLLDESVTALKNGKLAISGGSMTGPVSFTGRGKIGSIGNGSAVDLMGGSDLASGGNVRVFGNAYGGDNAGGVAIFVTNDNGTDAGVLRIQRGGITWNGKLLVTTATGQKRPDYAHLEDITGTYFNAQSAAGFSGYTIDFDGWIFARPTRNENRQVALVSGTTSINFACRQASEACHWGIVPVKNGDKLIVYTHTNDNYGYYYGKVIPTIYTTESSMYVQIIKVPEV